MVGLGDGFVVKTFFPFLLSNGFARDGAALLFFAASCLGAGALILFDGFIATDVAGIGDFLAFFLSDDFVAGFSDGFMGCSFIQKMFW